MLVYFLKDMCDNTVDAVIMAETSTKEDIEKAIAKAKEQDDFQWDDLVNALPNDCSIYDRWSHSIVYY